MSEIILHANAHRQIEVRGGKEPGAFGANLFPGDQIRHRDGLSLWETVVENTRHIQTGGIGGANYVIVRVQ